MRWFLPISMVIIAGCASTSPAEKRDLRVLVYNIHAGKDASGVANLDRVAAIVATSAADVVLLQEVDRRTTRSSGVDHLDELKKLTGFHGAYGKSLDFQGGEYGIAILSRWPIESEEVVRLRVDPPQERSGGSIEPRVALVAKVAHPAGLTVINTHLDASRDDGWRLQEIRTIAAHLRTMGRGPVLLGGDLNTTPENELHSIVRAVGLIDQWSGCGTGEERTYPASAPTKRIDYLYADAGWKCQTAQVLSSDASDHRPVLFVLSR